MDIPDLVRYDAGDEPFVHIVSYKYPTIGSGGIYTGEYWQSVIDGIVKRGRPLAGGKTGGNGHDALENDFYIVGAKNDTANKTVYFKVVIPKQGFSSSNEGLIRALKNGVGEFSIVANVKPVSKDGELYFYEETGIPRFDYVDEGAMEQANTNALYNRAIELIRQGKVDTVTKSAILTDGEVVYKKWLLYNQSSKIAGVRKIAGRLLNELGKGGSMTKEELIEALKNLISTGGISKDELLAIVGVQEQSNEDKDNAKLLDDVKAVLGVDDNIEVLALVKELVDEALQREADGVAESEEVENSARAYATKELKAKGFRNRHETKKQLATDAIFLQLKNKKESTQTNSDRWWI